jgi:hypothetical protein
MSMFEKPKRKRSPKHRLTLLDWRWRLLVLAALYGFVMFPTIIILPLDFLMYGFLVAGFASFGMGYVVGWSNKHISTMSLIKGCLVAIAALVFMLSACIFLVIPFTATMFSSTPLLTFVGAIFLPMPLAIHIGMAGEKLANRNYQRHNQPKAKREYNSTERLSDEYYIVDDDSFDVSESNEVQQKFNSLEG